MRGIAVVGLLACVSTVRAQEWTFPKDPVPVKALECEVAVPEGWTVRQDHVNLVAHDAERNGFILSREPMLQSPEKFGDAWAAQLSAAEKALRVEATKVGRFQAWRAAWKVADADRQVEVWRVHAPDNEMVYNFAFSAKTGLDIAPLVQGVLKSFKCTAPKSDLKLETGTTSLGGGFTLRLPTGFQEASRGFDLGEVAFYYDKVFVRFLPGYKEPHCSMRVCSRTLTADRPIGLPNGKVIQPGNVKDVSETWWDIAEQPALDRVEGKPKGRSERFGGMKGASMWAEGVGKDGTPKEVFVFAGKEKQNVVILSIVVDAREVRLHKDFFKDICSTLESSR